jgi:FtsZ-interacting cell division protein ZipA
MDNKKKIIFILLIIIIIIIFIIFFLLNNNKKNDNDISNKEQTETGEVNSNIDSISSNENSDSNSNTSNIDTKNSNIEKSNSNKITNNKTSNSNSKNNNKSNTNNKTSNNTSNKPSNTITYKCPSNYRLDGTNCIHEVNANRDCPKGLAGPVKDNKCINLSDPNKYETKEDNCPSTHYFLAMTSLFEDPKYYCYPLYDTIYTCEDGYTLNGNKCIKVIKATN